MTTSLRHERQAREEARQALVFLAEQRQQDYTCETAYCGDLEMLTTWRWLLGFNPTPSERIEAQLPHVRISTLRLWALAWRVNTAFPAVDVVSETVREWQRRQTQAQASGVLVASEDAYGQIREIAAVYCARERERRAAYQTDVARCVLSSAINALGTNDELKLLAEAGSFATCYLPHPGPGDLGWVAVFEDPTDTSHWVTISGRAGHLSERWAYRGPHRWPTSLRQQFREWQTAHRPAQ